MGNKFKNFPKKYAGLSKLLAELEPEELKKMVVNAGAKLETARNSLQKVILADYTADTFKETKHKKALEEAVAKLSEKEMRIYLADYFF